MFKLSDLPEFAEKIEALIPKIKELLPKIKDFEAAHKMKLKLEPDEILLYSAIPGIKTFTVFVFRCTVIKSKFELNGKTFPENSVIVREVIAQHELMQYIERVEKEGIVNVASDVIAKNQFNIG
jgi:hypothetical protein